MTGSIKSTCEKKERKTSWGIRGIFESLLGDLIINSLNWEKIVQESKTEEINEIYYRKMLSNYDIENNNFKYFGEEKI